MSTVTYILGESGSGKTTSLRNLDPKQTLIIQAVNKRLPFKSEFVNFSKSHSEGSLCVVDGDLHNISQSARIMHGLTQAVAMGKKIIVIDDFQYLMANEYFDRAMESGFKKFAEIGVHAWDVLRMASKLPDDVRVYFLWHTILEGDTIKAKTIGKMLDEKGTPEGLVTIVLRSVIKEGEHYFLTKGFGNDTVKTPMGMFDKPLVPNDLKVIDDTICSFWNIGSASGLVGQEAA